MSAVTAAVETVAAYLLEATGETTGEARAFDYALTAEYFGTLLEPGVDAVSDALRTLITAWDSGVRPVGVGL